MADYNSSDFGWQLRQLQQHLGEWLEWQLSQSKPKSTTPTESPFMWLAPYLTWGLGILLLGLFSFLLVKSILQWRTQRLARRLAVQDRTVVVAPPPVGMSDWLQRAQDFQRQGNFTEAARSLYFALLENLHERQVIPEKSSRTDREYIGMTERLARSDAFSTLLTTHEQIEFSGRQVSEQEFESCQQAYGTTQETIQQASDIRQSSVNRPSRRRSRGRRQ